LQTYRPYRFAYFEFLVTPKQGRKDHVQEWDQKHFEIDEVKTEDKLQGEFVLGAKYLVFQRFCVNVDE
jgi:hypothetical protein